MDEMLMRYSELHHCSDCETATLFVPVPDVEGRPGLFGAWCCTACDAAIELGVLTRAA